MTFEQAKDIFMKDWVLKSESDGVKLWQANRMMITTREDDYAFYFYVINVITIKIEKNFNKEENPAYKQYYSERLKALSEILK